MNQKKFTQFIHGRAKRKRIKVEVKKADEIARNKYGSGVVLESKRESVNGRLQAAGDGWGCLEHYRRGRKEGLPPV